MDSNLARRVGFAVVAIPLALLLVWFGGLPLALLLAVAGALATRELFGLAERRQVRPATLFGILTSAAIAPVAWAALGTGQGPALAGVAPYAMALWLLLLLTWALAARGPADRPLEAVAVTSLAVAYAGALPAFLLIIRHGQHPLRSWAGAWQRRSMRFSMIHGSWMRKLISAEVGRIGGRLRSGVERTAVRAPPPARR